MAERLLVELDVYPDNWVLSPSFPERWVSVEYVSNDGMQAVMVADSPAYYPVIMRNIRAFNLKAGRDQFALAFNLYPEQALAFRAIPVDYQRRSGSCRVRITVKDMPLFNPSSDTAAIAQLQQTITELSGDVAGQNGAIAAVQSALATLTEDLDWAAVTLLNGWANFGAPFHPVGYCIDPKGVVRLRGVAYGTASTGTVMFTLPEGLRPLDRLILGIATGGVSYALQFGRVDVLTDGSVEFLSGGLYFVSFDGLSFVAG